MHTFPQSLSLALSLANKDAHTHSLTLYHLYFSHPLTLPLTHSLSHSHSLSFSLYQVLASKRRFELLETYSKTVESEVEECRARIHELQERYKQSYYSPAKSTSLLSWQGVSSVLSTTTPPSLFLLSCTKPSLRFRLWSHLTSSSCYVSHFSLLLFLSYLTLLFIHLLYLSYTYREESASAQESESRRAAVALKASYEGGLRAAEAATLKVSTSPLHCSPYPSNLLSPCYLKNSTTPTHITSNKNTTLHTIPHFALCCLSVKTTIHFRRIVFHNW